ncbi:etoposide-induced protein 2.4 homolog isoform X2 [Coccinella septempunctata]|uniref:etoposide-induced protein 2.4 homolog isoform X2 n=1 Tax=Coccinella septempunctata TaxID=41139 RepID=UPI001D08E2EB|nr:etoposide-induced protein 2.4 homolog isoform X2 [Coccinella septempunctata]
MDCEIVTLALKGICDSFHGFLYVPVLLMNFCQGYFGSKLKESKEDTKIVEALKTACIYNFIYSVIILPVLYILCPLCNIIFSKTISEDLVLSINTFFYNIGLIFRILPVQVYKAGHFYLFQDIAKLVHIKKKGKPQEWGSVQVRLSDTVFNLVVQFVYGGQLLIISFLPSIWSFCFPNTKLYFLPSEWFLQFIILILTSIWYSLCLFEYKWYFLAWNLHKRLGYIERNWPYFIGFSFFYAVITTYLDSYCLNALIAGILFPFYLISAYEADPEESIGVFSIPFFQPSVVITNTLIKMLNRKKN